MVTRIVTSTAASNHLFLFMIDLQVTISQPTKETLEYSAFAMGAGCPEPSENYASRTAASIGKHDPDPYCTERYARRGLRDRPVESHERDPEPCPCNLFGQKEQTVSESQKDLHRSGPETPRNLDPQPDLTDRTRSASRLSRNLCAALPTAIMKRQASSKDSCQPRLYLPLHLRPFVKNMQILSSTCKGGLSVVLAPRLVT